MNVFKTLKLSAVAIISVSMSCAVLANGSLNNLNTNSLKSAVALSPTAKNKLKVERLLNTKTPYQIETGAVLKKVKYSKHFNINVQMSSKTADKYSSDETDSLNRFVNEKIHPFYCSVFANAPVKPDLYVDIVDNQGKSFFGSAERYSDTCQ